MAVTQRRTVELRPWNAYQEPAFPEGQWFAHFLIAHAGGGGLVTAEAIFQEAGESLSSRLWSLEQITYETLGVLGGSVIEVRTLNLETFQRAQVANQSWGLTLISLPSTGRAIIGREAAFLPWFLGAPRIEGLSAGLNIIAIDGGIGERSGMMLQGYYWGPAARNAAGGPQRPPTGLYGP